MLTKKYVYEKLGGLDENHLKIAFNDLDFCLRLVNAGYRIVWTPFAELYHHESYTRGREDTIVNQDRFAKEIKYMEEKWNNFIAHDPAFNPNLSLSISGQLYAFPPRVKIIR